MRTSFALPFGGRGYIQVRLRAALLHLSQVSGRTFCSGLFFQVNHEERRDDVNLIPKDECISENVILLHSETTDVDADIQLNKKMEAGSDAEVRLHK